MSDTHENLLADYLTRLRAASRELPHNERNELRSQIEEHLRDAVPPHATEAETRTALDRIGDPQALVAEHRDRLGLPARCAGRQEWAVIILLLIGGFIFAVGWIVGAVMLWSSRAWTAREKLIGTLLVPGGLAASLYIGLAVGLSGGQLCEQSGGLARPAVTRCTGGASTMHDVLVGALIIALLLVPLATAIFLARRARAATA